MPSCSTRARSRFCSPSAARISWWTWRCRRRALTFLASMLPGKPRAELYTSLGLQKHGKTLFYRDFLHHLRHSTDAFVIAPGIRGLVMIVFTLPSYPYVFKGHPRHHLADQEHRPPDGQGQVPAGRSATTASGAWRTRSKYTDVAFRAARFDPALIAELEREVPSLVEEEDDTLIVKHLYIERRMTPLNLYVDRARRAAGAPGGARVRQCASRSWPR